jgi:hypothetical protein
MTVEAIFGSGDSAVTQCNVHLTISIEELQNTLKAAFPQTLYFFGQEEQLKLTEIVTEARRLSFQIQHGFVTNRLFVTVARGPSEKDDIMGTYAFGLDRLSGDQRVALMEMKAITISQLQTFPN